MASALRVSVGLLLVTVVCGRAAAAAQLVVADPMELNGGWGDFHWTTGVAGLRPSAGSTLWGSTWDQPVTLDLRKNFAGVSVQPGTYTVSIDTAAFWPGPTYRAVALSEFSEFGLLGVGSPRQVISADTPPLGVPFWTTWSVGYTVPPDSPDVGKPLGFAARVSIDGDAYTIGFDNLRITYDAVPEPTSAAVFATAAVPLLLLRTRHRN